MAIKWSDLKNKTRELEIQFQGETVKVTYFINVVTPAFFAEITSLVEKDKEKDTLVWQLSKAIKDWDVLDDKGKRIKPESEFLSELPVAFLNVVMNGITSDMKAPDDESKKS